eukprot:842851-Pyramimonas_sp.AAC.1
MQPPTGGVAVVPGGDRPEGEHIRVGREGERRKTATQPIQDTRRRAPLRHHATDDPTIKYMEKASLVEVFAPSLRPHVVQERCEL